MNPLEIERCRKECIKISLAHPARPYYVNKNPFNLIYWVSPIQDSRWNYICYQAGELIWDKSIDPS